MEKEKASEEFLRLLSIMDDLREKCPWDRKQTIQTLRPLTIEEMYELADSITDNDWAGIKEELGDLLLHIAFYTRIAEEQRRFSMEDVIQGICEKLISRHPHIYGTPDSFGERIQVKDEEEVKRNWEKLKLKEGKLSVLSGVPLSLPALVKATRLQEKAAQVGFEWEQKEQVWEKVEEEIQELKEALTTGDQVKMEEELGDLFFSLVNYARFLQIDPENALERTNKKFTGRFKGMELIALSEGKALSDMTLKEMDSLWDSIKKQKLQD
jgi:MazG family protein